MFGAYFPFRESFLYQNSSFWSMCLVPNFLPGIVFVILHPIWFENVWYPNKPTSFRERVFGTVVPAEESEGIIG